MSPTNLQTFCSRERRKKADQKRKIPQTKSGTTVFFINQSKDTVVLCQIKIPLSCRNYANYKVLLQRINIDGFSCFATLRYMWTEAKQHKRQRCLYGKSVSAIHKLTNFNHSTAVKTSHKANRCSKQVVKPPHGDLHWIIFSIGQL